MIGGGGDGGGDSGAGEAFVHNGGGEGGDADLGHPTQSQPIEERPRINGAPITEQSHEFVIMKRDEGPVE
jgi:hypothetical protein